MKRQQIYFLIPTVLFALQCSCEKVVDFQQSAYQPKLVLYGAFFADSVPELLVGKTRSYYGWEENIVNESYVEGAAVSISEGQTQRTLSLGNYQTSFFNLWTGYPGNHASNTYNFDAVPIPDSVYKTYRGQQVLEGGVWYQLRVEHELHEAERSFYLPQKGRDLEARMVISDSSFRDLPYQSFEGEQSITRRQYTLLVEYSIDDQEPLWHKPSLTFSHTFPNYYYIDPVTGEYFYFEDSITAPVGQYASFALSSGAGRYSREISLGYIDFQEYTYPDGSMFIDTFANLPFPYEESIKVARGDSLSKTYELRCLLSHNQDDIQRLAASLLIQQFGSSDPFSFSEPAIVNTDAAEGIGPIGAYSLSEPQTIRVTFR